MYGSLNQLNVAHVPTQIGIREWVTAKTFADAYEKRQSLHTDIAEGIREKLAGVGYELIETYLIDMTPTGGLKAAMTDLLKVEMEGQVALAREPRIMDRNTDPPAGYRNSHLGSARDLPIGLASIHPPRSL